MFAAIRRLEACRNEVKHPLMQRWELPIPIELGRLRSGEWASSVPDVLTADGRMGVAIGEDVADARQALVDAIADTCPAIRGCGNIRCGLEWWGVASSRPA